MTCNVYAFCACLLVYSLILQVKCFEFKESSNKMVSLALRRALRSWSARRWCGAACLAAAALAAARLASPAPPAPPALLTRVSFPHAQPARVAHLLADFSTHPSLFSMPVSWSIDKEASNYTSWRYSVSYACGARCAGRAAVEAHDVAPAPRHGHAARAHRVLATNSFCVTLPLLPWPQFCGEIETIAVVTADEVLGGAVLEERASARCGVLAAWVLRAQCGRQRLHALRDAHLRHVRRALGRRPAH